jgi:hypothetical protein
MTLANSKTQIYSKQGLWSLFLMCAFPLHFWTLLLAFRDISWLTERSNLWDAIGVVSYGMVFAFSETVIIFLVTTLLGLLVSKHWDKDRRIALLSILILITSLWAIISQLYVLMGITIPDQVIIFLAQGDHPLRYLYLISLVLVTLTFLLPTHLVLRSDKALRIVRDFTERISLLTMVYLFFDLIGLIVVIIRNI